MGASCSYCRSADGTSVDDPDFVGLHTTKNDHELAVAENSQAHQDPSAPSEEAGASNRNDAYASPSKNSAAQAGGTAATTDVFTDGVAPPTDLVTDTAADGVPVLGPIGSGGWVVASDMTPEMANVRDEAVKLFKEAQGVMTPFNTDYLTPATLQNYIHPPFFAPDLLAKAIAHRQAVEEVLNCRTPVYLNGSCRVIGWDSLGRTVIAHEPSTMRAPLARFLDHFEYTFWSALDMNKPGANGCVVVLDVGGGYNWKHFLSVGALKDAMVLLKNCFHGRLAALFMVDMPSAFRSVFNMALGYAEEATRKRIQCLSGPDALIESLQAIGLDEDGLNNARGYTAKRRDKRATQTFSPVVDVPFFRDRLRNLKLDTDTECFTENHHKWLRVTIQEFRVHKWGIPAPVTEVAAVDDPIPTVSANSNTERSPQRKVSQKDIARISKRGEQQVQTAKGASAS